MRNYKQYLVAKELLEQKQYKLALKKFKKLYKSEPDNESIKFEFAKVLVTFNQIDKAKKYFKSLLKTRMRRYAMLELAELEATLGNMAEAIQYYEHLPQESYVVFKLGRLETYRGNVEKASNYFEQLLNTDDRVYGILGLLDLNIYCERYETALIFLKELTEYENIDISVIKQYQFYIEYKLGKINNNTKTNSYFGNQILNYSKERAIDHIKLHLDENDSKANHSMFSSNVSIEELFALVQNNIKYLKRQINGPCDKYYLDLGYIVGVKDDIETSIIKIITIANTQDIITMYPFVTNSKNVYTLKPRVKEKTK